MKTWTRLAWLCAGLLLAGAAARFFLPGLLAGLWADKERLSFWTNVAQWATWVASASSFIGAWNVRRNQAGQPTRASVQQGRADGNLQQVQGAQSVVGPWAVDGGTARQEVTIVHGNVIHNYAAPP